MWAVDCSWAVGVLAQRASLSTPGPCTSPLRPRPLHRQPPLPTPLRSTARLPCSTQQDRVFPHGDFDSFIGNVERLSGTHTLRHELHELRIRLLRVRCGLDGGAGGGAGGSFVPPAACAPWSGLLLVALLVRLRCGASCASCACACCRGAAAWRRLPHKTVLRRLAASLHHVPADT